MFLTVGILVRMKARKIRNPILNSRERKRLSGMDKALLSDTVNMGCYNHFNMKVKV